MTSPSRPRQLAREARDLAAAGQLVTVAQVAAVLGVDAAFVYEHSAELGVLRLGSGPRARLRFDLDEALRRLTACSASRKSVEPDSAPAAGSRRRRRSGSGTTVDLLPIRGGHGER
jgi:hypothetical protein